MPFASSTRNASTSRFCSTSPRARLARARWNCSGRLRARRSMPVAFGGGIVTLDQVERILKLGVEKVVINSEACGRPSFITEIANRFGSQSVVISINVRRRVFGSYRVYTHGADKATGIDPTSFAKRIDRCGGRRDSGHFGGTRGNGAGLRCRARPSRRGCRRHPRDCKRRRFERRDFVTAVRNGHASAVAASSMFIYHGKHRAVLISFPEESTLRRDLYSLRN